MNGEWCYYKQRFTKKCPECGESFSSTSTNESKRKLERHRASEHNVNQQISWTCPECGKKFVGAGQGDIKFL